MVDDRRGAGRGCDVPIFAGRREDGVAHQNSAVLDVHVGRLVVRAGRLAMKGHKLYAQPGLSLGPILLRVNYREARGGPEGRPARGGSSATVERGSVVVEEVGLVRDDDAVLEVLLGRDHRIEQHEGADDQVAERDPVELRHLECVAVNDADR